MRTNRKACREGHFDCIGIASRDDRCALDPTRCTVDGRGRAFPRPRHSETAYWLETPACSRCGEPVR